MDTGDEIVTTVVNLGAYTWDWTDIAGVPVQVRLEPSDPPVQFRFRPKPGYVMCTNDSCAGCTC